MSDSDVEECYSDAELMEHDTLLGESSEKIGIDTIENGLPTIQRMELKRSASKTNLSDFIGG